MEEIKNERLLIYKYIEFWNISKDGPRILQIQDEKTEWLGHKTCEPHTKEDIENTQLDAKDKEILLQGIAPAICDRNLSYNFTKQIWDTLHANYEEDDQPLSDKWESVGINR